MNSKVEPLDKIDSKIQFKCINVKYFYFENLNFLSISFELKL